MELGLRAGTWRSRALGDADAGALQGLCAACDDYFVLVFGRPATTDEAAKMLAELPEGVSHEDKHVVGFFDATERLRAVLDLVAHYPSSDGWFVGELLIEPAERGRGSGSQIVEATVRKLQSIGATRVGLAVAEQNVAARRFWERHGFQLEKRWPPRPMGLLQTVLLEMRREL